MLLFTNIYFLELIFLYIEYTYWEFEYFSYIYIKSQYIITPMCRYHSLCYANSFLFNACNMSEFQIYNFLAICYFSGYINHICAICALMHFRYWYQLLLPSCIIGNHLFYLLTSVFPLFSSSSFTHLTLI